MMSTESQFRKQFGKTMDSQGQIIKNSEVIMQFDYGALTGRIGDGTYSVKKSHFKPMTKSCIFDFATFALERPGFRIMQTVWAASAYGVYFYTVMQPFLVGGVCCGVFLSATTLACLNALMLRRINIASITILPDGESVRLVTFKGLVHDVLISEFELVGIRKKNLRVVYKT